MATQGFAGLQILVSDTGIGIKLEDKEKVPAQVCTEWLDAESMKKLATELRAACEACDLPALDSLVEKMEQLPLPKDLLEQVAIAVENIDFDAVQELAHTMDTDA